MPHPSYTVRHAKPEEFTVLGQLMVQVYSNLDNFPKPAEQPAYYQLLTNIGDFTQKPGTEILVSLSEQNDLAGGVVFFQDMQQYGSGGTATQEKDAAGFRLLAVAPGARGKGAGKLLTLACLQKAKDLGRSHLIIHSTKAMQTAWSMYEKLGFKRAEELDFMQGELPVFGFRLGLQD